MKLSDNATYVFRGFLNLPNLEKLSIVEAINEYFDSNDRATIRNEYECNFDEIVKGSQYWECNCCGSVIPPKSTSK